MNPVYAFSIYWYTINLIGIKYSKKGIHFFHFKHLCPSVTLITEPQKDIHLIETAHYFQTEDAQVSEPEEVQLFQGHQ